MLNQNKRYVEIYKRYMTELDGINKNLKLFRLKKSRIVKKGIFATDEEVKALENNLYAQFSGEEDRDQSNSDEKIIVEEEKSEDLAVEEILMENDVDSLLGDALDIDYIDDDLKIEENSSENESAEADSNENSVEKTDAEDVIGSESAEENSIIDELEAKEKNESLSKENADENSLEVKKIDDQPKEIKVGDLEMDFDMDLDDIFDSEEDSVDVDLRSSESKNNDSEKLVYAEDLTGADNSSSVEFDISEKIYKFSNGDIFIGKIINGNMEGTGSYLFNICADDNIDELADKSEIVNKNVEYIGVFRKSQRKGEGSFYYENGNVYIGFFDDNLSNGLGMMKYHNGDEYIGHWKNGKKHGHGIYTWKDGFVYEGYFVNSRMEGSGRCYDANGRIVYEGEWKDNLVDGKGKYIWHKGKYYEGDFQRGMKHGEGKFYLYGELIYDGTWKYDKPYVFDRSFDEVIDSLLFD